MNAKPVYPPATSVPTKAATAKGATAKGAVRPIATNRKAFFNLDVEYTLEAGLSLVGTEVKSLRGGHCLLQGAHVRVIDEQAFLFGLTIREYAWAHQFNHQAGRPRRLLLHAKEIEQLAHDLRSKGTTAVLAKVYWSGSRVKAEIAVGVGRKEHDKRDAIKDRETKRDLARVKR
ncbi:MAG: SsrA-binding protein SmpB [Myxococcales bacterium]|nr:SsrA-binding protein SmpB [Myxococcales bacterium]